MNVDQTNIRPLTRGKVGELTERNGPLVLVRYSGLDFALLFTARTLTMLMDQPASKPTSNRK